MWALSGWSDSTKSERLAFLEGLRRLKDFSIKDGLVECDLKVVVALGNGVNEGS